MIPDDKIFERMTGGVSSIELRLRSMPPELKGCPGDYRADHKILGDSRGNDKLLFPLRQQQWGPQLQP